MDLLRLLMRTSRAVVLLAMFCGLLAGLGGTGLIATINRALASAGRSAGTLALSFAGLVGLVFLSRIASQVLLNHLYQDALYRLRLELTRRILGTPLRRIEEHGSHRLLAALADDVLVISNGLMMIPPLFIALTIMIGCAGYLAWLSWKLFLVLLGFLGLGLLSYWAVAAHALGFIQRARETQDTLFKHFRGLTEGLKELKLNGRRRSAFLEALGLTATSLKRLSRSSSNFYAVASIWGTSLFFIFIGLLLFALPSFLAIEASALTGYTLTVLYLQQPLDFTMSYLPILARSNVALRKVESLGLSLSDAEANAPASVVERPRDAPLVVELIGVTHSYRREQEDGSFTLGPIDLRLQAGELVFLVGGNGSGKTTLAKVLTGLYSPEAGQLLLNGAPVTAERQERYREHFSAVFSDFYLFESLLGLAPPDREPQVRAYLEKLHLDRKVRVQAGELSTVDLSQGQRKRLALLAAYLEDRPICVFDEWAADQDPQFKEIFYKELLPELRQRGKLVVVISHDDRYFHVADRILRLEAGQLEEVDASGQRAVARERA